MDGERQLSLRLCDEEERVRDVDTALPCTGLFRTSTEVVQRRCGSESARRLYESLSLNKHLAWVGEGIVFGCFGVWTNGSFCFVEARLPLFP